ncbi:helix-turn-helix transcriptional regulator [Paraflavitalea sp. CAU 1676]|uniref:AraC family transcriptional regulator n=1 Tax=Paraflavitalea sp. CAU 1676 TaxID=3032598 RepID=UPI0023DADD14|nr:helix-turn-helix transcriptional regulator [Paraflavitalea sp. CAU 1676]MDF2190094.1 helix-turn-helix transcriptional regulator [Paraflavitalea sp. CAU 1676]
MQRISHIIEEQVHKGMFYLGYFENSFPVSQIPHRHKYFEILWFTKADGVHDIDGVKYPLTENDLFLISQGQVHSIVNSTAVSGYMLCFNDNFWHYAPSGIRNLRNSLFNNLLINARFCPTGEEAMEITRLMRNMVEEFQKADYSAKTELLAAYTKVLLIKIDQMKAAALKPDRAELGAYHLFERLVEMVEQRFAALHEVAQYAAGLGVAPRKLTAITKQFTGKTAKEIIDSRIVSEAKRYLQFSDLSVKEISNELNFADQYQFSKYFKKHTGTSPLDFRQSFAHTN